MGDESSKPTDGRSLKPARETPVTVPRWAQAVFIPLGIILVFYIGRSGDPRPLRLPHGCVAGPSPEPSGGRHEPPQDAAGPGVILVYLSLLAVLVVGFVVAVPPLAGQLRRLVDNMPQIEQALNQVLMTLQQWLASNNIVVDIQGEVNSILASLQQGWTSLAGALFNFSLGVLGGLVTFLAIIFTSFYMLIDGRRIHRFLVRLVPAESDAAERYLRGLQTSFSRFVRGQMVLGLTVGMASGLGVWILGWPVVNVWPEGSQYVLLFGVWRASPR